MTSPQRSFYFYIAFQKNSKIMYKQIIRPLLFLMDPEKAFHLYDTGNLLDSLLDLL